MSTPQRSNRPARVPVSTAHLPEAARDEVLEEVLHGLQEPRKRLSPIWFYDEVGSRLFDQICELPEYYPTRTETGILTADAPAMAELLGPQVALVEYGSGTSVKTRLLLDALLEPHSYVPVDVAHDHLLAAARVLARDYPALQVIPVHADFTRTFVLPKVLVRAARRVVFFPGSTIGNFTPWTARLLLRGMHSLVGAGGAVLVGVDLKKDVATMERAYDDAGGVTAAFNRNALRHLNVALGTDFDPEAFRHRARWVPGAERIEMHLVSKKQQTVSVRGETISFARGEVLHTENCHKYTTASFTRLALGAGLAVRQVWTDPRRWFAVFFLEPQD